MAIRPQTPLTKALRRLACSGTAAGLTDGQLLDEYVVMGNETAFSALVKRHGPMVRGVCWRVLGNSHDADDAFQAVFLILLRKAKKIVERESVGSWLHGVAYRTAMKAKGAALRRRARERNARVMAAVDETPEIVWRELRPILDEEIARLPEECRLPFVLCYLQGSTNSQAARQLGWSLGTVATRLAQARQLLRKRLTRRGAVLGAGLLMGTTIPAAFAAGASWECATQVGFAREASQRATALAKGVMKTMWMTKTKVAVLLLVLVATTIGVGGAGLVLLGKSEPAKVADKRGIGTNPATPAPEQNAAAKGQQPQPAGGGQVDLQKQFVIECLFTTVDAKSKESFAEAKPTMVTVDGISVRALVGTLYPIVSIAADGSKTTTDVDIGIEFTVTVVEQKDGRFQVDCTLAFSDVHKTSKILFDDVLEEEVHRHSARCISMVKSGDTGVIEVNKDKSGDVICRVAFTLTDTSQAKRVVDGKAPQP